MKSAAQTFPLLCLLLTGLVFSACARDKTVYDRGSENEATTNYSAKDSSSGGFAPFSDWKPTVKDERYLTLLKSAAVEDRTYSWNTLASAIIVKALPYSPKVAAAAEHMHGGRPYFSNEVGRWGRNSAFNPGAPVVILMGLYVPDLKEKDVTKLERFSPVLITGDGRELKPLEIKRYGRASDFIRDNFPVFNHWEEVYMLKFPAPSRSWQRGTLSFRLDWPGGAQDLKLQVE